MGGGLSKQFVESVSAGRFHVAALGGPLNAATGKAYEGYESTLVHVWGRGQEGQLGLGNCADSATPQLLEALRDRRILQVWPSPLGRAVSSPGAALVHVV